jgi:hypothetical protein
MYDEIWTAGKVMYKLEPVVAPGGKLIIYAPRIRDIAFTWGEDIEKAGYHTAEYYMARPDDCKDVPRGVLGHCALVKGAGTYSDGIEKPRIEVVLATGISEKKCKEINLGYMNPAEVDIESYRDRESEGVLLVEHAGEMLHRLEAERG